MILFILNRLYIYPRVNWHRCAKPMVSLGIWSTNGGVFHIYVSFLEDSTCLSSIFLGWIGWNCQRVKVGGPDFLFSGLQKKKGSWQWNVATNRPLGLSQVNSPVATILSCFNHQFLVKPVRSELEPSRAKMWGHQDFSAQEGEKIGRIHM
jgi:hypothetical protein